MRREQLLSHGQMRMFVLQCQSGFGQIMLDVRLATHRSVYLVEI